METTKDGQQFQGKIRVYPVCEYNQYFNRALLKLELMGDTAALSPMMNKLGHKFLLTLGTNDIVDGTLNKYAFTIIGQGCLPDGSMTEKVSLHHQQILPLIRQLRVYFRSFPLDPKEQTPLRLSKSSLIFDKFADPRDAYSALAAFQTAIDMYVWMSRNIAATSTTEATVVERQSSTSADPLMLYRVS